MKKRIPKSFSLNICESKKPDKNGYTRCTKCKGKVALVSLRYGEWEPDQEPYKNDEFDDSLEYINTNENITGHYCYKCEKLTSIYFCEY